MLRKKEILDNIVHELTVLSKEIDVKASNNLLEDNVLAEDFYKEILNVCMGWNLVNLNSESNNYPGIDLGDKERRIGVQISSTKTSKKIKDSLDEIVSNNVDHDYDEIYFFILGEKQKSYTVDFDNYSSLNCDESNIWDYKDIISWCKYYDVAKLKTILEIIQREIVPERNDLVIIPNDVKKYFIDLNEFFTELYSMADYVLKNHYYGAEIPFEGLNNIIKNYDICMPYLDEFTFRMGKQLLENAGRLKKMVHTANKWKYEIEALCLGILYIENVRKNIQLAKDLVLSDQCNGIEKNIKIVFDGDDLFERIHRMGIDEDIIKNQFSIKKCKEEIENKIYRKCDIFAVYFSDEKGYCSEEMKYRLESEGTKVVVAGRRQIIEENISSIINGDNETVLVSINKNLFEKIYLGDKKRIIYTISFCKDIPSELMPLFFAFGEIDLISINRCFIYKEGERIGIRKINEVDLKRLLSNANDCISHQVRVDLSGDVFISTITGADEIDDLKFRFESWDAGNGYAGPRAASDQEYVNSLLSSIKKCWEEDVRGYCDYYAIF